MQYDIIFITGEKFFDHPLSGIAILKRLLEKNNYTVGIIEQPKKENDIKILGKPKLFFGVSSGSIDSMVRNYTPLKKKRIEDKHSSYNEYVPDRAVTVYCNWIKHLFKDSTIVLGGTEATLRRFVHYDYWDNKLRRPILFDSRADIIAYGPAEKQILEISSRLKNKKQLENIPGTCIITKEIPKGFIELPSYEQVLNSKEKFCDMQNLLSNSKNLVQKIDNRYLIQYKSPIYTSKDLDEYYSLPFTREITSENLRGFDFSIVTHRGCIGNCNFCSLRLTQGNRILSRSEESILKEIENITKLKSFKGNIDDFTGPSSNMYGMDCKYSINCDKDCIDCKKLDRSNKRLINLLRKARSIKGVKNIFIRSGIRYDLASKELITELAKYHISGKLKIAPEHINKEILTLMNKNKGDLKKFIDDFKKTNKSLAFYFMTAHPGSTLKEARELADFIKRYKNTDSVQIFTPTPMTVSTCMYYTSLDPKTKKRIYIPYTFSEKKKQKKRNLSKEKINILDFSS